MVLKTLVLIYGFLLYWLCFSLIPSSSGPMGFFMRGSSLGLMSLCFLASCDIRLIGFFDLILVSFLMVSMVMSDIKITLLLQFCPKFQVFGLL